MYHQGWANFCLHGASSAWWHICQLHLLLAKVDICLLSPLEGLHNQRNQLKHFPQATTEFVTDTTVISSHRVDVWLLSLPDYPLQPMRRSPRDDPAITFGQIDRMQKRVSSQSPPERSDCKCPPFPCCRHGCDWPWPRCWIFSYSA